MSTYQNYRMKNRGRLQNCYQSCLKKTPLFIVLFLLMLTLFVVPNVFAGCDYLSSADFGSGSGWSANQESARWRIYDGMLDVREIKVSKVSSAWHDFVPPNFFSIDTDISILNATDQYDRVGVQTYSNDSSSFTVGEYTTNGVTAYYYPATSLLRFKLYDFKVGKWVSMDTYPVSGSVNSIGLSMVADGVIFRINGQDTNYKISGDFSFVSHIVTLRLLACGSGLHARFDNICASAYGTTTPSPGNSMPLPNGREVMTTTPVASPVVTIDPAQANPFGFGAVASGGNIFSLSVGLSSLAGPVDLYAGIGIGSEIYLFADDNRLHPATDGLVRWRSNTTGGINAKILPDIDMTAYPGTYTFYLLMAPTERSDVFRQWTTSLVIGDGSSGVTDKAMEEEIKQYLDLIFGLSSGFSGDLKELTKVFSDKNVVTTSPAKLDLESLLAGTPITITADFGSGYTMESGSVMAGNAQIVISNVKFGDTGMGADFSGTFNDVTKDGDPFVTGQVSGEILIAGTAEEGNSHITGQIILTDLQLNGQQLSGTIQISGTMESTEINDDDDEFSIILRLTFTDFISGADTIHSGYVDIDSIMIGPALFQPKSGSGTITTNLQTSKGLVRMGMRLAPTQSGALILATTAPGTMGPYTVSINDVTMDLESCPNYPTEGNMSFSKSGGATGVVTFTGACDGSYQYSER